MNIKRETGEVEKCQLLEGEADWSVYAVFGNTVEESGVAVSLTDVGPDGVVRTVSVLLALPSAADMVKGLAEAGRAVAVKFAPRVVAPRGGLVTP